ncbi:plastocyanin/azurin family copper-binding protein [Actomonas aquatica]|uniref:Azurin n=1 Tax=Actomonas aquatica TaxID=2866162 RepID=A0ABZ1C8C6_9BACT|nr:azurin [Opitutus sp. WL0086]WRQ87577.1 azurin [Opitutus sp. WL0086]
MLPLLALGLTISLSGCGKKEAPAADHAAHAAAPAEAAPAAAATAANEAVVIEANDQMKFNVTKVEAKAGSSITLTLKNVGKLPKTAMGHNLVVLKQSANATQFATAAMGAAASEYIPANMADQVIAHTKLLGPGESDSITFTVPSEPGEYVFLCSFPAHFMAGMKGLLVVTE